MDLEQLRTATAAHHEAVEASIPLMQMDLDQATYITVLLRMHAFVVTWEHFSEERASGWIRDALQVRSRRHLLEADLRSLGAKIVMPDVRPWMPSIVGNSGLLGAMYVMEGSKLGGQIIARHVRAVLNLHQNEGILYFLGHGDQTGLMWSQFLGFLRTEIPDGEAQEAISSAQQMFASFGECMRQSLESPAPPRYISDGSDNPYV